MIGIFQGSPEGRANKCQRRAKGGLPRATSKKQGKIRAWEGDLPKTGQFGSYDQKGVYQEGGRRAVLSIIDAEYFIDLEKEGAILV